LGEQAITNPKHAAPILAALDDLPDTSTANVVQCVLDLRRYNLSAEFAAATMGKDRKKADKLLAELIEIWDKSDIADEATEVEYAKDWKQLDSVVGKERRISLGLASLDDRIGGGCLPGHHVLIFGRTEIGKSCLTVSLAANLVSSGKRVL